MEEIFGEIEDEHDNKEYVSKAIAENQYILSGRLEIDAVNEQFNLHIPESDDYVTIAGFILYHCGKLPKSSEIIAIDDFSFQILNVSKNKIELVKLTLSNK
jgi:CBS domain containing-hemolysin-like protein